MFKLLLRLFYNPQRQNQKMLKPLQALVCQINQLEADYQKLSDANLSAKTNEFRQQLAQGASLDSLLVPAFATVREASRRVLGMRHFDVQLIGGMVLHRGMIAEMKTGEGKTLVATLPVYLNALAGKGVHVVTVNDYLATRDSSIMAPLYQFLGLSVGCIVQDLNSSQRYAAYHADITYGTNNEFGFDFLRDNMKFKTTDMCQRDFHYAIVDEVDSILIDEARTPLIISGQAEDASSLYQMINDIILKLSPEHFEKDEKNKNVYFTEAGYEMVEHLTKEAGLIGDEQLFQPKNLSLVHHLNQSLRAQKIYYREIDYIVRQGQVVLIDEFTGRMMKGRRFSDGLHQALEAKEHVEIEAENQTLASITFQNYFRMYTKLAGMTGTAETEAAEFQDIYKLPVVTIPTNVPVQRQDLDDEIFRTFEQKKRAVIAQIKECHGRKQPVLVGTLSIEKSEIFAQALEQEGLQFHVLNARHHEKEAHIIAQAGVPGAITIATNMAGRGTDIKLGGNVESMLHAALEGIEDPEERVRLIQEVKEHHRALEAQAREAGGLFVLGTERNENRRIDNQLRGRTGRQGDPGASKFFISLEDDLMRIFGPNLKMLDYSMQKSEQKNDHDPMTHPWLTRSIEKAQQRIEAQHFDTRKHLLKYADVLNAQRSAVYAERRHVMELAPGDVRIMTMDIRRQACDHVVRTHLADHTEPGATAELLAAIYGIFGASVTLPEQPLTSVDQIVHGVWQALVDHEAKRQEAWGGEEDYAQSEQYALLRALDQVWVKHLNILDQVRSGIHLQAYGQKDPLNEYRHEAFALFHDMKAQWHATFLQSMLQAQPQQTWHYDDEDEDGDDETEHDDVSLDELLAQWGRLLQQQNPNMTEDEWEAMAAHLLESAQGKRDDDEDQEETVDAKTVDANGQQSRRNARSVKGANQRSNHGDDSSYDASSKKSPPKATKTSKKAKTTGVKPATRQKDRPTSGGSSRPASRQDSTSSKRSLVSRASVSSADNQRPTTPKKGVQRVDNQRTSGRASGASADNQRKGGTRVFPETSSSRLSSTSTALKAKSATTARSPKSSLEMGQGGPHSFDAKTYQGAAGQSRGAKRLSKDRDHKDGYEREGYDRGEMSIRGPRTRGKTSGTPISGPSRSARDALGKSARASRQTTGGDSATRSAKNPTASSAGYGQEKRTGGRTDRALSLGQGRGQGSGKTEGDGGTRDRRRSQSGPQERGGDHDSRRQTLGSRRDAGGDRHHAKGARATERTKSSTAELSTRTSSRGLQSSTRSPHKGLASPTRKPRLVVVLSPKPPRGPKSSPTKPKNPPRS